MQGAPGRRALLTKSHIHIFHSFNVYYRRFKMIILHVFQKFESKNDMVSYVNDLYAAGVPQNSRSEKGCHMYDYFFSRDRENEMVLIEKWETEEDLKAHQSTDLFKRLPEIKEPYKIEASIERFDV